MKEEEIEKLAKEIYIRFASIFSDSHNTYKYEGFKGMLEGLIVKPVEQATKKACKEVVLSIIADAYQLSRDINSGIENCEVKL